jgi:hypothetical protein
MNGEILRHSTQKQDILNKSVLECLQSEKLQIRPPVQERELIFIKYCRLSSVRLESDGVHTTGVLSLCRKKSTIKISHSEQDLYLNSDRSQTNTLVRAEKGLIKALIRDLQKNREHGNALILILTDFLKEINSTKRAPQFWS